MYTYIIKKITSRKCIYALYTAIKLLAQNLKKIYKSLLKYIISYRY